MTDIMFGAKRLLKLLSRNMKDGFEFSFEKNEYIVLAKNPVVFEEQLVRTLHKNGAIDIVSSRIKLTRSGLQILTKATGMEIESGNSELESKKFDVCSVEKRNEGESPLLRLYLRKTNKGAAYLARDEFDAGERLRMDFERGHLQPRITANLGITAGLSGKGGFHQAHEISDFALDARDRVNNAVDALGPELSGVTLDVCCFLKGLELVEKERQWPPRSAKLLLKAALSKLARHYGISSDENVKSGNITVWGGEGYRPYL